MSTPQPPTAGTRFFDGHSGQWGTIINFDDTANEFEAVLDDGSAVKRKIRE